MASFPSVNGIPEIAVGADSVDSTAIIDGEVMAVDLGVDSVTTNAIVDGAVTSVKLAPGAGFDPTSDQTITGNWDFTAVTDFTNDVRLTQNSGQVLSFGTTGDVTLERGGANILALGSNDGLSVPGNGAIDPTGGSAGIVAGSGAIVSNPSSATGNAYAAIADGDAAMRWRVDASGKLEWGDGTAAPDVNLYRGGADQLRTDDNLRVDGSITVLGEASQIGSTSLVANAIIDASSHGAALPVLRLRQAGDSAYRLVVRSNGNLLWGAPGADEDTNLYRSAANTLKTDDSFVAAGTLSALGSFVGSGLLLGPSGQVNLFRNAANRLETNSGVEVGGALYTQSLDTSGNITMSGGTLIGGAYGSAGNNAYWVGAAGDGFPIGRFTWTREGGLSWGDGTAGHDTNLYRSAADTLKTDDHFVAASGATIGDAPADLVGFHGATPIAQQATPVTLGDVITVLQNLGLVA